MVVVCGSISICFSFNHSPNSFVTLAANLSEKGHFRVLFQAQVFWILRDQASERPRVTIQLVEENGKGAWESVSEGWLRRR
jgi:hypothetical protein